MPEVDPGLLRRALANHTDRDGYRLALIHRKGDRRYDLDGQPVGAVTVEERTEAAQRLAASTQQKQAKAEQIRIHHEGEEKRRQQREMERRNREAKAARKAENLRRMEGRRPQGRAHRSGDRPRAAIQASLPAGPFFS